MNGSQVTTYTYDPQPDITVHELAQIVPILYGGLVNAEGANSFGYDPNKHYLSHFATPVIEGLPDNVRRHFRQR